MTGNERALIEFKNWLDKEIRCKVVVHDEYYDTIEILPYFTTDPKVHFELTSISTAQFNIDLSCELDTNKMENIVAKYIEIMELNKDISTPEYLYILNLILDIKMNEIIKANKYYESINVADPDINIYEESKILCRVHSCIYEDIRVVEKERAKFKSHEEE